MIVEDDGGPAFPIPHQVIDANDDHFKLGKSGMSLRDWFAGQALMGLLAFPHPGSGKIPSNAALDAYAYADAMLAARKNTSGR